MEGKIAMRKPKKQANVSASTPIGIYVSALVTGPSNYMLIEVSSANEYGDVIPIYRVAKAYNGKASFVELKGTEGEIRSLLQNIEKIL